MIKRNGWIESAKQAPFLTRAQRMPDQFGVPVLVWPPHKSEGCSDVYVAFYGTRVSDEPCFYIYGKAIDVQYWQHLPEGP